MVQGTTVISDRYAFSGIAFSAAKGLQYEWCRAPDVSLPAPDLTIFLDILPGAARSRGGYGEERYEVEDMQSRVREVFNRISAEISKAGNWVTIDAGDSIEDVQKQIWHSVETLSKTTLGEMTILWDQSQSHV